MKLSATIRFTTPYACLLYTSGRYGVEVITAGGQQVVAVKDGTVIESLWSPDGGYIIHVQHSNNLVSVYRHNSIVHKQAGERVRGGEVIGCLLYTSACRIVSAKAPVLAIPALSSAAMVWAIPFAPRSQMWLFARTAMSVPALRMARAR